MSLVNMQKAATVSLTKNLQASADAGNDPGEIEVELEEYIDTSTSMSSRYEGRRKFSGYIPSEMQTVLTRNLALLLAGLDADHTMPVYAFDRNVREVGVATEDNYEKLLDDWLKKNRLQPYTYFMPIFDKVMESHNPDTAKLTNPRVIIVNTDGVPADAQAFLNAIVSVSDQPIFWIFFGHGQSLEFLRKLDTMDAGRTVDNVALVEVDNADELSDEDYYDSIVEELIQSWFPAIRAAGITRK